VDRLNRRRRVQGTRR